jgi:Uma2 family endonuclease
MGMSATTLLTWEQFLELEESPGKQELLDGELISWAPAKMNHVEIAQRIYDLLKSIPHGYRVWIESGYRLRRGWLVPDVSLTRPDHSVAEGWMQGSPAIAIEVVSPTNRPAYIDKKTAVYLEEGAAEVWVVHPENRSMSVFRKGSWERATEIYTCGLLHLSVDLRTIISEESGSPDLTK